MNYVKLEEKNYNLHVVETDKFKTVMVKINFKRKLKKDEISMRNMLVNILFESTKKYPTKRLMEIQTEELYELGYRGSNYSSGIYNVMGFDCIFLHPKFSEEGIIEDSFEFLKEILFNPNIDENGFDKKSFDISYKILEDHLNSLKENADLYSQIRLYEELEPDSIISYRKCGYPEDLGKINRKNLYEYYLDVLKNDIIDIFVVGDVKANDIKQVVNKLFEFGDRDKKSESHFYVPKIDKKTVTFKSELTEFNQSKLLIGLKIKDASDFELRYVLNILNYILGGSPDSKLFQNVREKNSLCYSVSSVSQPLISVLLIHAGINAFNYDRACSLIFEQLEDMKKGKFSLEDMKKAVLTYKNSMVEISETPDGLISLYSGIEYLNSDTIEDRIKKIESVTKEDVISLANKIILDTIFFLEGGESSEDR